MSKPSANEFRTIIASGDLEKIQEIEKRYPLSTRHAFLTIKLQEKLSEKTILFSDRIIISYSWDNDELKVRAEEVSNHLKGLGYDVYLDQNFLNDDANINAVSEFVSNIATCGTFLILATKGYFKTLSGETGRNWVYDEFKYAASLASAGKIRLVCAYVEGVVSKESKIRLQKPVHNSSKYLTQKADENFVFEQYVDFHECFPQHEKSVTITLNGDLSQIDTLFESVTPSRSKRRLERLNSELIFLNSLRSGEPQQLLEKLYEIQDWNEFLELRILAMNALSNLGKKQEAADLANTLYDKRISEFHNFMRVVDALNEDERDPLTLQLISSFLKLIVLGPNVASDFTLVNQPKMATDFFSPLPDLVNPALRIWAHWAAAEVFYRNRKPIAGRNHVKASLATLKTHSEYPSDLALSALIDMGHLCLINGDLSVTKTLMEYASSEAALKTNQASFNVFNYWILALWGLGELVAVNDLLEKTRSIFPENDILQRIKIGIRKRVNPPFINKHVDSRKSLGHCTYCLGEFQELHCSHCGGELSKHEDACPCCLHTGQFLGAISTQCISFRCPICLEHNGKPP